MLKHADVAVLYGTDCLARETMVHRAFVQSIKIPPSTHALTELTSIKYLVVSAIACGKPAFGNNTIPKVRTKDLFKIV